MAWRFTLLLMIAALCAGINAWINPQRPLWSQDFLAEGEVSVAQVLALQDVLFVDARTRVQFEEGSIPGAILLNEEKWDGLVENLLMVWDPEQPVVVFCDSLECNASHAVAERLLAEYGLENVQVLKGGWQSWNER